MKKPPLLPAEALRRVLRFGRFNGTGVLIVAGAFALGSASGHEVTGTAFGLLIAGTGAMELHGAGRVQAGDERGMGWMIASQFALMAIILGYVGLRLRHIDVEPLRPLLTQEQRDAIAQAGLTADQFLRAVYVATYAIFGGVTLVYQSAVALYYRRRQGAVAAALRGITE